MDIVTALTLVLVYAVALFGFAWLWGVVSDFRAPLLCAVLSILFAMTVVLFVAHAWFPELEHVRYC